MHRSNDINKRISVCYQINLRGAEYPDSILSMLADDDNLPKDTSRDE
jgi:hypothetical protein